MFYNSCSPISKLNGLIHFARSVFLLVGFVLGAGFAARLEAADSPREHLSLDANWKFHLGDNWPDAISS